jgi:hypothetical protein
VVKLTDELLEQLGREYEMKKTEEIYSGVYELDTFYEFLKRRMKELQHDTVLSA